jgi:hypothetical protein
LSCRCHGPTAGDAGDVFWKNVTAAKLWFDGQLLFSHIEDTRMFQEAQPYHPKLLNKGQRFEI